MDPATDRQCMARRTSTAERHPARSPLAVRKDLAALARVVKVRANEGSILSCGELHCLAQMLANLAQSQHPLDPGHSTLLKMAEAAAC